MWLLFGNKTRVRPVEGGRSVERYCDECKSVQKLVECEVEDRFTLFAVSLADMKSSRMVCSECGEDYDLPPVEATGRPVPLATRPPPAKTEGELDEMLAALKKKMRP